MAVIGDRWTESVMLAHARSRRTLLWAGVISLAALGCAFTPLFNVLGFEFAFTMALVGSIASADLGAAFVRRLRATDGPPLERAVRPVPLLLRILGRGVLVHLALLALPLLVIVLNAVRVRNCDWGFGLQAFLLMSCFSVAVGTTVGVLCGLVAGPRHKLSNALPHLVLLASIAASVHHFYAHPPVFNYNMFVGYFPGSLYDASISFGAPFYWARLFHLSLLAFAIAAAAALLHVPELRLTVRDLRPIGLRYKSIAVAALAGSLALSLWTRSGELGFSIDTGDIRDRLAGVHRTKSFVIYYPRGGEIERDIELIAEDHEFRYAQLARVLDVDLDYRITSYYFQDADQKFDLMGIRRVYMAKPWLGDIYLSHNPFPHSSLRHEIAHVLAGAFGDSLFGVSVRSRLGLPLFFNVGLIEGLAVALDWPAHYTGSLTPHQSVKAMMQLDFAPSIRGLFSTRFLTVASARSYTTAGSFVRFLLDTYGVQPLRALYRSGGDFMGAYGQPRAELARRWRAFIADVKLPPNAAEIVRERFRRRSIFKQVCPRAIARKRQRAAGALVHGEVEDAIELVRSVCSDAPHEPYYQLELAGLLTRIGKDRQADDIYSEIAADAEHVSSSLRAEALMRRAALAMRAAKRRRAAELLDLAAALPLDEERDRQGEAQRFAIAHTGPAGDFLRDYFWKRDRTTGIDPIVLTGLAARAVAAEPELALGHYLLGRMLSGRGAPERAAESLASALEKKLSHPLLEREAARLLAVAAYRARRYELVERAAAILTREDQPEITRLLGADWLERLHWKRTGKLP